MTGAVLLLLVAPFHAAAYFNTEDGSTDLLPWQTAGGNAMRDAMPAAFDFSDPYQVYKAYGIGTAVAFLLLAYGYASFQGVQETRLAGWRRNVGRVAAGAWACLGITVLLEYTTPFTDSVFPFAALALLTLIACTAVSGFAGARNGAAPPRMARALAIGAATYIPLVVVFGHIPMGSFGFALAWLAFGPALNRSVVPSTPPRPAAPAPPRGT